MQSRGTLPRGRHAPPLEVRIGRQRARLFGAAAAVFSRSGYAAATAEAIAREAGMSKATFYEHFDNKEDCLRAMCDAAIEELLAAMRRAGEASEGAAPRERVRAVIAPLLTAVADFPDQTQTLLVEIVGAGPRVIERRDRALEQAARHLDELNRADAERGVAPRFASPHDAYAIVGAVVELASRQLRTGTPADMRELEPVVERLVLGLLDAGEHP